MDDFDRFVNDLQREIDERTHALYSDKVLAEVRNPRNMSRMDAPDAYASVRGPCGDTMKMYLRLDGERIIEATFTTDGCGPTVASGSKLTTMVRGMSLAEADALTRTTCWLPWMVCRRNTSTAPCWQWTRSTRRLPTNTRRATCNLPNCATASLVGQI